MLFTIRWTPRKSQCSAILIMLYLAGMVSAQTAYFVDGYHGGVYGGVRTIRFDAFAR